MYIGIVRHIYASYITVHCSMKSSALRMGYRCIPTNSLGVLDKAGVPRPCLLSFDWLIIFINDKAQVNHKIYLSSSLKFGRRSRSATTLNESFLFPLDKHQVAIDYLSLHNGVVRQRLLRGGGYRVLQDECGTWFRSKRFR